MKDDEKTVKHSIRVIQKQLDKYFSYMGIKIISEDELKVNYHDESGIIHSGFIRRDDSILSGTVPALGSVLETIGLYCSHVFLMLDNEIKREKMNKSI